MTATDPAANGFMLFGHRGARGLYPENTLEGFQACLNEGVKAFELDVAVTRDGVAVVHHDPALHPDMTRDADGRWIGRAPLLRDMTMQELRQYDVGRVRPGSATAARFPRQRAIDGAKVPSLVSVLKLPAEHFLVEIKSFPAEPDKTVSRPELIDATLNAIAEAGVEDRVTIESFDWAVMRGVHERAPHIPRAWLTEQHTIDASETWWGVPAARHNGSVPQAVAAEGAGAWAPAHDELTEDSLAEAHKLGLKVLPWTVNETADMQRLIGWGVDGLITDRPDLCPPEPA